MLVISYTKHLILFLLLSIYTSEFGIAQFSVKILNEDFNSNTMRWDIKNDEYSEIDIQLGKYSILNKAEGTAITSTIESPHLQYDNFRIKSKLSKTRGIENNGFGLVWGSSDANNEFEFVISANGFFKIVKWEQGQKEDLIGWTYQSAINKWDFNSNELKIESDGVYYRYFINDTYVALTQYTRPFGNRLGFVLNENLEVEIDYIEVENLTKSAFSENVNTNYQGIQLGAIEFASPKHGNTLYYNDTAFLNIEIINPGNMETKDLIVSIDAGENTNNLLYNSIVMINLDKSLNNKQVSIGIIADETIKNQSVRFNISLKSPEKRVLDAKNITFQTVGINSYSNDYTSNNYKPETPDNYNPGSGSAQNNQFNQNATGCGKSCVISGLVSVLIGVILTLL